jgi:hypothetical protein
MKWFFMLTAFAAVTLLCSCTTYVITPDGQKYEALSKDEISRLIIISRLSLKDARNKNLITRNEYHDAMTLPPEVKIEYRGDRFGTAHVIWRTRDRLLEYLYHDDLTAEVMPCSFSVSYIPPEERRIMPDKSIPGR